MSKVITKQELTQLISKADVLEVACETIKRQASLPTKSGQSSSFDKKVQAFIKEQRDIVLIAVKLR